jgi:hypothetical protein
MGTPTLRTCADEADLGALTRRGFLTIRRPIRQDTAERYADIVSRLADDEMRHPVAELLPDPTIHISPYRTTTSPSTAYRLPSRTRYPSVHDGAAGRGTTISPTGKERIARRLRREAARPGGAAAGSAFPPDLRRPRLSRRTPASSSSGRASHPPARHRASAAVPRLRRRPGRARAPVPGPDIAPGGNRQASDRGAGGTDGWGARSRRAWARGGLDRRGVTVSHTRWEVVPGGVAA